MNPENSKESQLINNPSTVWAETERLVKAYRGIMTNVRYKAFAALWQKGNTLREIADILGIREGHCSVVQMRARKSLGKDQVPYRTMSRQDQATNAQIVRDNPSLSVAKLADMLRVSRQTIYNLRRLG